MRALCLVALLNSCGGVEGTVIEDPVLDAGVAMDAGMVADAGVVVDAAEQPPRWMPRESVEWQIQLTGTLDTSHDVPVYDVDLFDTSSAQIRGLQDAGRRVICYVSVGTHEDWRADAGEFPAAVLGNPLPDFPDERWLDIRAEVVRDLMTARLSMASDKGCDAVQLSSVDAYTADSGFDLVATDQLAYNRFLAREAHARGLAVGLTNDYEQIETLLGDVDFGILLDCFEVGLCDRASAYLDAGKAAFHSEPMPRRDEVCALSATLGLATVFKYPDYGASRSGC